MYLILARRYDEPALFCLLIEARRYSLLYPMDFKMDRDGKEVNPREHRELCGRGERVQPTKRQLER